MKIEVNKQKESWAQSSSSNSSSKEEEREKEKKKEKEPARHQLVHDALLQDLTFSFGALGDVILLLSYPPIHQHFSFRFTTHPHTKEDPQ